VRTIIPVIVDVMENAAMPAINMAVPLQGRRAAATTGTKRTRQYVRSFSPFREPREPARSSFPVAGSFFPLNHWQWKNAAIRLSLPPQWQGLNRG
jgi:hypothetical protein